MNILNTDRIIFLYINHLPHNLVSDSVAYALSGVGTYGFIWFVIGLWLFIREEERDHRFFIPFLSAGLVSLILIEYILKPLFGRLRPGLDLGAIILGSFNNDSYSFPSGHATIAFALAGILAAKEPKWKWWFYVLAILIALSRIYLGQHFPSDVIAGAILGWGIGAATMAATGRIFRTRIPDRMTGRKPRRHGKVRPRRSR